MEEERWDIYDREGKTSGRTMARNSWPMQEGDYHASVICAIKNSAGEYLISQRAADKEWGAGWWEFPGGGVRAGETPEEACLREVREETGLSLLQSEISHALRYYREDLNQGNNYFMDVFTADTHFTLSDVKRQADEVQELRFAPAEEIAALGQQGIFLHYDSVRSIFET